jgi:hypothetical protein
MDDLILVYYVGVSGIRSEDINDFVREVLERTVPDSFSGHIIGLPVQSVDTRIECINPKYVTKKLLINEHNIRLSKLNEELQYQMDLIKKGNNENE